MLLLIYLPSMCGARLEARMEQNVQLDALAGARLINGACMLWLCQLQPLCDAKMLSTLLHQPRLPIVTLRVPAGFKLLAASTCLVGAAAGDDLLGALSVLLALLLVLLGALPSKRCPEAARCSCRA